MKVNGIKSNKNKHIIMKIKRIVETLALVFCIILSGCGEKKITVKGSDGTEYESYQECCTAADFVAAHRYIDRMESQGHSTYEARDYVFREEALYLMSLGDDNAKKRIVYLLKQDDSGSHDEHCDMLVELAIDADDEAFVKNLTRHYNGSIDSDILRKIVEYLYIEKGDDSNLDFVTTLLNRYDKEGMLLDAAVEKGDEKLVVSLATHLNGSLSFQTFKKVMDFLEMNNNNNYKILFNTLVLVVDRDEELIKYAAEKGRTDIVRKYYHDILEKDINVLMNSANFNVITQGIHEDDISVDGPECNERISAYNQRCIKVLHKAIGYKQLDVANKVIRIMKPNIVTHTGNSGNPKVDGVVVGYGKFYAQYVNSEINEAKNILNEAVRSGAFK